MNVHSKIFKLKSEKGNSICLKPKMVQDFLCEALDIVFPGMTRRCFNFEVELNNFLSNHLKGLHDILSCLELSASDKNQFINEYENELISIIKKVEEDAQALLEGDPAAKNMAEVVLSYPGLEAVATYRIAHFFYQKKIEIIPRMFTEIAHRNTGIDIHPGAKIGNSFFIDHGTAVVIGETAVIGDRVKIYQGVTLGALSVEKKLAEIKRHPTIEEDCVLYAHATILGGSTVVGKGSVVGGNVWLTKSVPAFSVLYHKSEIRTDRNKNFDKMEELTYEI